MKKIIAIAILASLFAKSNLFAYTTILNTGIPDSIQKQEEIVIFSGRVINDQGNAIEYATAILLQEEKQQAGVSTDNNGYFRLETKTGNYTLIIQCLGHQSIRKDICIPTTSSETYILKPSAYALKDVVVKARNIERKADRFVINVSPSTGKDGTELLSQAPGVWISDGKISINGASGTKVFVDHREIKLTGEELLSYLHSLKSADIKQIEVIPIAGAEYDANSSGGIILISLRQRQEKGMQGNIMMGTAFAPSHWRYLPSGTLNTQIGKWIINAAASATFTPDDKRQMTSNRLYPDRKTNFSSLSNFDIRSTYGTGRIGAIFEIDTLNSIGAEIEYIGQASKGESDSRTFLSKEGITIDSQGDYYQLNDYKTLAATANYMHKFDHQGSVFKWIVDYANKRTNGMNDYRLIQHKTGQKLDSIYKSHADATFDILTTDISINKKIKKTISAQAGLKYTYTNMNDKSCYEGLSVNGNWEMNPAYGYALKYKENIIGAYITFSAEIARLSLKAGLRGEYTRASSRSDTFGLDYFDLFPNLNITYAFDPAKTQMLVGQYIRNIERPAFYTLSPNHIQYSDYSYQIGNPYLKPTYINRFSLTWVYQYQYTVTIGGNLHRNLIRELCKPDPYSSDISYITFENHNRENHWFIAVNLPFQLTQWCNLSANIVGVKQDIRMTEQTEYVKHYLLFANATASVNLPKGYNLEMQYGGNSRLYSGNSEIAPRYTLDLTIRKMFMNDRLLATIGITNIFNRFNDYANNLNTYRTETHYREAHAGRIFKIALSWHFNSGKKVSKKNLEKSSAGEFSRLDNK